MIYNSIPIFDRGFKHHGIVWKYGNWGSFVELSLWGVPDMIVQHSQEGELSHFAHTNFKGSVRDSNPKIIQSLHFLGKNLCSHWIWGYPILPLNRANPWETYYGSLTWNKFPYSGMMGTPLKTIIWWGQMGALFSSFSRFCPRLPSGKRSHNYGKIHSFSWENPL